VFSEEEEKCFFDNLTNETINLMKHAESSDIIKKAILFIEANIKIIEVF